MPISFIASLLLSFSSSAAVASVPPGPPPWLCHVWAACDDADLCVFLHTLPIRFKLTQIEGNAEKYHLEGYDNYEKIVLELPSLEDAKRFARGYSSIEPAPLILIPNNRVADSNGFWLHTIAQLGTGQRILIEEKMLVSCDSIRKS